MDNPTADHIAQLKAEIDKDPMSEEARVRLLQEFLGEPLRYDDPLRIEQIRWLLQHRPRHPVCATPFVAVDPESAPVAYAELKAMWLRHVAEAPTDVKLVRGAAAFIAKESTDEGKALIRSALTRLPDAAALWFDLGRISRDPGERLAAYEKAREFGEQNSNLLVWIAETAFEAGEFAKAQRAADELIALVDEARARYGDKLDWTERGRDIWLRAREVSACSDEASEIVDAIAQHGYRKHWAHTVLGLLACRDEDVDRAIFHLRESANLRPDYRLSSYGPSGDLLRQVCIRGRWEDALIYVGAWENTWDDERLEQWTGAVMERRVPGIAEGT